jgi:hypothetical protein
MALQLPPDHDVHAWQMAIWNLPDDFVSRPQKLQLMLMLENPFNAFDPFRVVKDLLAHRDLWRGVVMDRGYIWEDEIDGHSDLRGDLIMLRDIEDGRWNTDTLFILTDGANKAGVRRLAKKWSADEVDCVDGDAVGQLLGAFGSEETYSILRVWWD